MKLSRKSRRNIAAFNKIKYAPSRAVYSSQRIVQTDSKIDMFVDAFKGAINDTVNSAVGEVVGADVSREEPSTSEAE